LYKKPFHEAGYDSYLTARVMILLSAKLEAAGSYIVNPSMFSEADDYHTAPESESSPSKPKAEVQGVGGAISITTNSEALKQTLLASPISKQKRKFKSKTPTHSTSTRSRFASQTPFEALNALTIEDESDSHAHMNGAPLPRPAGNETSPSSSVAPPRSQVFTPSFALNPSAHPFNRRKDADALMPPFESDFWRVYANKLRIFGTEERFLDLDPTRGD
jgi:poly(A)-specific ribonuclease